MSGGADGDDGKVGDDVAASEPQDPADDRAENADGSASEVSGPIQRFESLSLFRAVILLTVVALIARVVFLGARYAHWDEARVAYWAYFYAETGSLGYHWEEHGPLVQIAARWLFEPFGVGDTATRLPVAVVGGLLPMAALLYRRHLRDSEVVALALFLAFNSVLLYYSRFMRSDVLVAAFMFAALGMLIRFADTRRYRYLYAAGLFVALGFGSKENAIIYLVTWAGATVLVADQWLHSPAGPDSGASRLGRSWASRWWRRLVATLSAWGETLRLSLQSSPADGADQGDGVTGLAMTTGKRVGLLVSRLAGLVVVVLATVLFIFADRGAGVRGRQPYLSEENDRVALGEVLGQPGKTPAFVTDTLEHAYEGYADWFAKSSERTLETYLDFIEGFAGVLAQNATVLLVFAVLGILIERYGRENPRWLVMFMTYCAVASFVGYPLGTDISGAWGWVSAHIVVPLAVPAAVGTAWLYRELLAVRASKDDVATAILAAVLLLAAVQVGFTAVDDVYRNPAAEDNELVQYAQPQDLGPVVDTLDRAAAETDGRTAILYYGPRGDAFDSDVALVPEEESTAFWDIRPTCSDWPNTQPMNWYFAVTEASVDCERSSEQLRATIESDPPPVILAVPEDGTVPTAALSSSYERDVYYTRTVGRELVVYTHESWT